jgi:hypothetical protein
VGGVGLDDLAEELESRGVCGGGEVRHGGGGELGRGGGGGGGG